MPFHSVIQRRVLGFVKNVAACIYEAIRKNEWIDKMPIVFKIKEEYEWQF